MTIGDTRSVASSMTTWSHVGVLLLSERRGFYFLLFFSLGVDENRSSGESIFLLYSFKLIRPGRECMTNVPRAAL